MQERHQLSDAKRLLFSRYLHAQASPAQKITRRLERSVAPLSVVQEQLYFRELALNGNPPLYNECITVHMRGPVDPNVLERSFDEIIRRHEIWRTTFETQAGQPVQIVHRPFRTRLALVDLRGLAAAEREAEAVRLVSEDVRRPFDLNTGPLLRPTLVRLSDEEHRLFLIAHQIILDGSSAFRIYPFELAAHYKAFLAGQPSRLPELRIQYSDFARWQREWLSGQEAKQVAFWRRQLTGNLPTLKWPTKHHDSPVKPFVGHIRPFAISAPLSTQVRQLSRRLHSTLFLVLLTGLATVIHRHTKNEDVIVGTLSPSGRRLSEVMELLGYFLNPVALRLNCGAHPTFCELLCHAGTVMADAISNDDVPIEHLARAFDSQNRSGPSPFFDVTVSLQPPTPELGLPWSVTSMDIEGGGSPWPLYCAFIDRPEGIVGRVQWNPDLVEIETVEQLLQEFDETLETVGSRMVEF
jgi:surfactin family lipopeptide synthetase A